MKRKKWKYEAQGKLDDEKKEEPSEGRLGSGGYFLRNPKDPSSVPQKLSEKKKTKYVKWIEVESLMCHQCQRNDKGRVVRCTKCKRRRYCIPCLKTWYPHMSEKAVAEACPFCRENCNCKACLRCDGPLKKMAKPDSHCLTMELSKEEKLKHSRYLLQTVLPF